MWTPIDSSRLVLEGSGVKGPLKVEFNFKCTKSRNTSKAKRSGGHPHGRRAVTIGDRAECCERDRDREVNRERVHGREWSFMWEKRKVRKSKRGIRS